MPTYDFATGNRTGVDTLLGDIAVQVPEFIPLFLLFIYLLIAIIGYNKQRAESGSGDPSLWATIAGVITTIVALLLSMGQNIITLPVLITTVIITLLSGMWLFSSKDRL